MPPVLTPGKVRYVLDGREVTQEEFGQCFGEPLLPEDSIVDEVAVEVAVSGERPVRLTATERELAAEQLMADGGGPGLLADRLNMSTLEAMQLYKRIKARKRKAA
ncbi:MAG TPA: hypothetical protein VH307_31215 [Streptosporangiaceae bacterium]|jgi:hypothetical protein|nr:hypothetical protein [Streptosporangiaceae bacterium]